MENSNDRKFFTQVITCDSDGNWHRVQKCLTYPGNTWPNGIGEFIDRAAYEAYINGSYAESLGKLQANPADASVSDELIYFEIGKTALMMILAQPACEGINLIQISKDDGKGGKKKSFIVRGILNER